MSGRNIEAELCLDFFAGRLQLLVSWPDNHSLQMDQATSPLRRSLTHESRRSRRSQILDRPRLGGVAAVAVFIAVLLAFTIQSDATTYVQSNLNFKRPYMLLYVVHLMIDRQSDHPQSTVTLGIHLSSFCSLYISYIL